MGGTGFNVQSNEACIYTIEVENNTINVDSVAYACKTGSKLHYSYALPTEVTVCAKYCLKFPTK